MSEAYRHPVEDIEPYDLSANDEARAEAMQMFREIVLPCLPSAGYGQFRRFSAGYNRWVVTCYETTPEWFSGVSKRDLAAYLGLSYRALMFEFVHVQAILKTASERKKKRQHDGSS